VVPGLWHRRGDVAAVVSLAEERLGKPPPVYLSPLSRYLLNRYGLQSWFLTACALLIAGALLALTIRPPRALAKKKARVS
jgi:hypothetical protein